MGWLKPEGRGEAVPLAHHTRVGRARDADLQLSDPRVSAEHAVLMWDRSGWAIKDLASRNGTFVDGARVSPGSWTRLRQRAVVSFAGLDVRWTLGSAGPPKATALNLASNRLVVADEGEIFLEDDADSAVVFDDAQGRYWLSDANGRQAVHDRDVVEAGGTRWRLRLPVVAHTAQDHTHEQLPSVDDFTLCVRVSLDEEYVSLSLRGPRGEVDLRRRSFDYMLLTLARARQADQEADGAHPDEHGWVAAADLAKGLGIDMGHLNVDVFRARRHFAAAGVREPSRCIERRDGSGKLRIGFRQFEIRRVNDL